MAEIDIILDFVKDSKEKTILEVGSRDDSLTKELAKHFTHVSSFYEFLKIPEYTKGNIEVKKVSYERILEQLGKFDVVLLMNEFHHFPDILQMRTYDSLDHEQSLVLFEWDQTGTVNDYYSTFQNCKLLCSLTKEILDKFIDKGIVKIEKQIQAKNEYTFETQQDLIDFFQFLLPDHFKYGKDEFMEKVNETNFPLHLWEGYNAFLIKSV